MMRAPARTAPALIAALGSAAGMVGLMFALRPEATEPPRLAGLTAFSQSAQQVAAAPASVVEVDDPLLVLERLAWAAARGVAEEGALARSCATTTTEEVCEVLVAHPAWGFEGARRVAEGQIVLGATAEQVEAAWGPPEKKRTEGDRVVWCYDAECASGMSMLGGRVVSLKE